MLLVQPRLPRTGLQCLLLLVLMAAAGTPPSSLSRPTSLLSSAVGRMRSCLLPVAAAGMSLPPPLLLLSQRSDSPSRHPLLVAAGVSQLLSIWPTRLLMTAGKQTMLHSQLQATGARRSLWGPPPVKHLLGHSRLQLPTWQSWRRLLQQVRLRRH